MKLSERLRNHTGEISTAIFLLLLVTPNILLGFTEGMPPAIAALNILLPLGVYALLLSISRNPGLTVWLFLPVIFLDAFQIVLLRLYGRSVIAVDMFLNLVTTNSGEVGELLSNMLPSIALVVVMYVPPLAAGIWMMRRGVRVRPATLRRRRNRALVITATAAALLVTVIAAGVPFAAARDIFPANAIYNASLAVRHSVKVDRYGELSEGFTFGAKADSAATPDVVVLVIGETSRADHWQLNGYGRPTNPKLSSPSLPGSLKSFTLALSESNTTHKSVPLMLSHLTPQTYGDSIYRVRSLVTAFAEAGYQTAFFSCQRHNRSFIDFFAAEADTTLFVREPDGLGLDGATDLALLDCLDGVLRRRQAGKPLLVVLHTYGSHFSYRDRYPATLRRFGHDDYTEINAENRDRLINSYDNTIALTDSLLSGVIRRIAPLRAAMVYTSDHGEDMLDDSRGLFLHASPCPSIYQVHVPFIVWTSDGYNAMRPEAARAVASNASRRVSSNTSFGATALDLGGIITGRLGRSHSLANRAYTAPPMLYLDDHNRAVPLARSGFTAPDLKVLSTFPDR